MTRSSEKGLAEAVILAPTEPIYKEVRRRCGTQGQEQRIGLFKYATLPSYKEDFAVAGPALGAPAAVLLMEQLVEGGTLQIYLLGVCGSLTPELRIGDLFIPKRGISEEGTSRLYLKGTIPPPDPKLTLQIENVCRMRGLRVSQGLIWTTDAPLRETREKIACFGEQGAMAVDMEFTALSTVARFHKVQFASLMVVSDEIFGEKRLRGFHRKEFRHSLKNAVEVLLAIDGEEN